MKNKNEQKYIVSFIAPLVFNINLDLRLLVSLNNNLISIKSEAGYLGV